MRRSDILYIITTATVVFSLVLGIAFIVRTGLPSADVIALQKANRPIINVSDFNPGDVETILLNNRWVIVWRRNETDRLLAARQNDPKGWQYQSSRVLGQTESVFADDTNLTLNGEWFFALAEFSHPYQHLVLRAGDFEGFLEGRYVAHFDLAGRIRKGGGSTNLTVIAARYVNDGQGIQLYLDGKP